MNPALQAAQTDIQFQFFLARLFGQFIRKTSDTHELQGYVWRDGLYITGHTELPKKTDPTPNQDSRP